jgi:GWxTD domain-containing protein
LHLQLPWRFFIFKGNFHLFDSGCFMKISFPWTGIVLLFANLVSAQISFNSPPLTIPASSRFQFRSADSFSKNLIQLDGANTMAVAPNRDDDSKKSWSGFNVTMEEKFFAIDYANFIAQKNLTFVEFYIQIGYDRLIFTRAGKSYHALYEIDFYVEDLNGNLLQNQTAHDEILVDNYDETIAPNNYRVILLSFSLKPDLYRLRAVITDKENGKSYEATNKFSVRDFSGPNLTLSDLQFSRNIQVDSSANAFVKHHRRIEPNVPRAYGQYVSGLFVYYEIYNFVEPQCKKNQASDSTTWQTASADSFQTLYTIRNESGEEVKQLWKSSYKPGTSCVQSVLIPIANLKSGQYMLTVRVFDKATGGYAEATGHFNMQWDILTFKDKKFEEILEQMCYIASGDERKRLAQLPESDRQSGLLNFWQRRDPTPGTPRNEAMEEYYRRLNYANARFRWKGGEGWKSPQGQIYITYGPPDNVRRYTNSPFSRINDGWMPSVGSMDTGQEISSQFASRESQLSNSRYEVWEYHELNRNFVFVDSRGLGVYELVDPFIIRE